MDEQGERDKIFVEVSDHVLYTAAVIRFILIKGIGPVTITDVTPEGIAWLIRALSEAGLLMRP